MSTEKNRVVWVSAGVRLGVPHPQVKLYLSQLPVAHLCPLVVSLVTTGSALEPGVLGHVGHWQPLCQVFQNCVTLEWVRLGGQCADGGPLRCSWPLPLALCLCHPPERIWAYSGGTLTHQMSLYSLCYEWIHIRGTSCLCGRIFSQNF